MAKAIKHTVLVVLGLLVSFTACQTDEWTAFQEKEAPEGYVLSSTYKCNFLGADNKQ